MANFGADVPMPVTRVFLVRGVPLARGLHAHRTCQQFLVCVQGALTALVDDNRKQCEVRLDSPDLGLLLAI